MSDLIDLTSPDSKKVLAGPKLSSPLIPLPANPSVDSSQLIPGLKTICRRSIDDNPFDIELRKTDEFISKSEDPFEVVWRKVNNADDLESHSANFKKPTSSINSDNDSHFKRKRHFDILKMNKTLDESLINGGESSISKIKHNESTVNANVVLPFNSNEYKMNKLLGHEELNMENKMSKSFDNLPSLSINPPSPDFNNLSILNQSVMNDSFSQYSPTGRPSIGKTFHLLSSGIIDSSNGKETVNQHNTSILNQSAMNDSLSGSTGSDTGLIKSIVARRIAMCIQKGITDAGTELKIPDEKHQRLRRSFSQGDQLSLKHFQQMHSQSNVGDRLQLPNDCSMPTISYEDPFNKGFMTGSSGDNTVIDISNISSIKRINSVASNASSGATVSINNAGFIDDTTSSARTMSNGNRTFSTYARHSSTSSLAEISDLVAQFDRLKAKSLHQSLSTKCSLIDIDKENSTENDGIQQHNTTTDSVFFENNPMKQSTSSDELVKSLNKCSLKASYESDTSGENSLPKRPPSAMRLLSNSGSLASNHNSDVTDNLIELQTSDTNKDQTAADEKVDTGSPNVQTNNDEETKIDVVKEFDKELIEPEKKLTAATLLMELEKLVNNEKNPKAVELLQNLERVLGVKCDNNVELLEMFIQGTEAVNEVRTNPEKDTPPLEKSQIPSEDTSKEDNTNVDSIDSPKQLNCDNFGINDNSNQINIEKAVNRSDKLSKVSDCYMRSPDKSSTTGQPECPIDKPENPFSTQKLVVDIQIALQNLLTSNNSDPMAFLESLNKVLNPTANESGEELNKSKQVAASPVRSIPKSPFKRLETSNSSTKSSTMRRSAGSTSVLKPPTGLQRHSSVSQIVRTPNERNTKIKTRVDSPKKSIPKRSSSDQESNDDIKITKKLSLDPIKLKPSVPIVNKKKLRTNNETTDKTVKRGPLKAFLPMSNMQQRGISAKKVPPLTIPPLSPTNFSYDISSAHMSITSTPNPDVQINLDSLRTSPKRKPVASSTPDVHSKISRVKFPKPSSPKHNMSWNISPVTPNEPRISTPNKNLFTGNNFMNRSQLTNKKPISPKSKSRSPSMRVEKTPETQKKISLLSRDQLLSQSEGKSRYGRRSEPVKNTITMKKIASPLKESNTPGKKINPLNLISKFQRRSSTKPLEKENKWK